MKHRYLLFIISLILYQFIMANDLERDTFKTENNKDIVLTFIKHGSLLLTYDGLHIQVDPVTMFADYTTFPKADFILITHEHADHLDSVAINQLMKNDTRIIINGDTDVKQIKTKLENSNIDVRLRKME